MKITEITHRRIRNLGNYQNAEIVLTASVDDGDDIPAVMAELKERAKKFLYPDEAKPRQCGVVDGVNVLSGQHVGDQPDDDTAY